MFFIENSVFLQEIFFCNEFISTFAAEKWQSGRLRQS